MFVFDDCQTYKYGNFPAFCFFGDSSYTPVPATNANIWYGHGLWNNYRISAFHDDLQYGLPLVYYGQPEDEAYTLEVSYYINCDVDDEISIAVEDIEGGGGTVLGNVSYLIVEKG